MKIAVDLDEILAEFLSSVIAFHNDAYNTNLKKTDFHSYKYWEVWGGDRAEAIQKVYEFHQTPYFQNIKPVAGAIEAIKILKEKHELYVITSRQDEVSLATKKWLDQYFQDTFKEIYFTNHYSQTNANKKKSDFCDSLNVDVLIEDLPEYAQECLKPNRKIILFDYPWNINTVVSGISRVKNWTEALEVIDKN